MGRKHEHENEVPFIDWHKYEVIFKYIQVFGPFVCLEAIGFPVIFRCSGEKVGVEHMDFDLRFLGLKLLL
jgi:hypothetical protein